MKIQVKEADGKEFTIPLPNAMLFSPMVLKLILRSRSHHMPELSPKVIDNICSAIQQHFRKYGSWTLVEVQSANGDAVVITI